MSVDDVLDDVRAERRKQDEQWGGARHDDEHSLDMWTLLLTKQIGKLADTRVREESVLTRRRLIVIAALAVAAVESFDRAHGPLRRRRAVCPLHGPACAWGSPGPSRPHSVSEPTPAKAEMPSYLRAVVPEVGDVWEWEPLRPARATVTVTDVRWNGETVWIEAATSDGKRWLNELDRWVEATVLVRGAGERE